jgi:hypothetical protein
MFEFAAGPHCGGLGSACAAFLFFISILSVQPASMLAETLGMCVIHRASMFCFSDCFRAVFCVGLAKASFREQVVL